MRTHPNFVSEALDYIGNLHNYKADHNPLSSPELTREYLTLLLGTESSEKFVCIWLDNKHHVISSETLFHGTLGSASVYPREVVKGALKANAAAVIFAHNHPSGSPEPSRDDERITARLKRALELVDVRVLDHIIIAGAETVSFAERGLL